MYTPVCFDKANVPKYLNENIHIDPEKFHGNRYKQIKSTHPRFRFYCIDVFYYKLLNIVRILIRNAIPNASVIRYSLHLFIVIYLSVRKLLEPWIFELSVQV